MNGTRQRDTGDQERSVVDDIRDMDPASWPYAGQVPPAQVALQEARRRQAQPGPQRVPTFTPTGPQRRLTVTAAQPQAPAGQPPVLQVHEHPEGTFTAASPWEEWLQRCKPRRYPAPEEATPFYSAALRDLAEREMGAALAPAGEPYTLAPPVHESWQACQQAAMTPLPECDAAARFQSARAYMRTMDRHTGTRGLPLPKAALPAAGAAGRAWAWLALADAIREAGKAVEGMRHGNAAPYFSLAEYVAFAPDYETAVRLLDLAAEAKLVDGIGIEDVLAGGAR